MFHIKLFKSFILHKIIIRDNDFDESQLFAFTTELRIWGQSAPAICTHCTHRSQTRAGGHITSQPLTTYLLRIATKNETERASECACMCVSVRVAPMLPPPPPKLRTFHLQLVENVVCNQFSHYTYIHSIQFCLAQWDKTKKAWSKSLLQSILEKSQKGLYM